jgi:hypothetical protein
LVPEVEKIEKDIESKDVTDLITDVEAAIPTLK